MSKLSPSLQKATTEAFAQNPHEDTLLVFPDGNIFLPRARNMAEHHGNTTKQELVEVHRDEVIKPTGKPKAEEESAKAGDAGTGKAKAKGQ